MRIIAGALGGRRLAAPAGDDTRPTSDRVREAIFNILGPPPEDARVLDLFAGSGALALEALSRGALAAVAVEKAAEPARLIAANAADLGVSGRIRVVRADVAATIPRLAASDPPFMWIFVDPPYARPATAKKAATEDHAGRALALLADGDAPLVAADGVVVVEHDRRITPPDAVGPLTRADLRRYGDTEVSFYRRSR